MRLKYWKGTAGMTRVEDNLNNKTGNYIFPFFWQNGADEQTLQTELLKIYESNIRAFCVEARPHPDYAGERWWHDMDIIMDFARTHDMKVWLLDDDRFPTGHANKIFNGGNHPLSVRFLTVHNTDVYGPMKPGYLLVKSIFQEDDVFVGAVAYKRCSEEDDSLNLESAVDVTGYIQNGWLRWEVPEGLWRILVFYITRHGNGKLDYFNIIDSDSVKLLLEQVYEPHYARYGADFGKTFMGFFSDEPEFSNLPGYEFRARLGKDMPFIPWSREFGARLQERLGKNFLSCLGALWYEVGEYTSAIRFAYMDEVTKTLKNSFSMQIGKWCKDHKVFHIGHVLEDDNSHGRLGCGTGHYFRALSDMRMAGIDVVTQQIMPGMDQKEHQWVASHYDGEFFHYGLAKMGSSLAHIDSFKKGDSMCEIFGAFGWQEGIGLMKWLTDHMLSRGINHFVPHSFSMKPFPDPDCPPHFYAHGNHPQYEHFGVLMKYMNRLSHLFTGGIYPAEIAVLYHADLEWAGKTMLFQKPVRTLMENQLDCDIVPADIMDINNCYGAYLENGLKVAGQNYQVLVVPGCEVLPLSIAENLLRLKDHIKIIFVDEYPERICGNKDNDLINKIKELECISLGQLSERVKELRKPYICADRYLPKLRTYPYWHDDNLKLIFCFNESTREEMRFELCIGEKEIFKNIVQYDAVHNICQRLEHSYQPDGLKIKVHLGPGESVVIALSKEENMLCVENIQKCKHWKSLDMKWRAEYKKTGEHNWMQLDIETEGEIPQLTEWVCQNGFCGTLRYVTQIMCPEKRDRCVLKLFGWIDCADIFVNRERKDRIIGTPAYGMLDLKEGINEIAIEIPLTPVWSVGDNWSSLTMLHQIGMTKPPVIGF